MGTRGRVKYYVLSATSYQTHNLQPVLAVGFSQGAPFAFALAEQGLVEAIAIVSGQDEFAHPRLQQLLHPDIADMVAAIKRDAGSEWFKCELL